VRVYTIGFGTPFGGEFVECGPRFRGNEPFGGGGPGSGRGGGGGRFRRGIDEVTLQRIAEMTGGIYYSAESGSELQSVFQNLPTNIIFRHEVTEISVAFTAIGALLAAIGMALSLLWHPLP
jgi:Ca-activated chloride channel family protein